MTHQDGVVINKQKSQQAHLKVYSCKAYYMITNTLKKINCLNHLKSRAWIGFLVNYNSTNIYQIWNPVFNKVIWTRDVIFNEKLVFDKDIKAAKLELKKTQITQNISLDQLAKLLQQLDKIQAKSDMLILDNDTTTVISSADDSDSDNHNSHED